MKSNVARVGSSGSSAARNTETRSVPRCHRCGGKMKGQYYKSKITWWTCEPCADEADNEPPKLQLSEAAEQIVQRL